MYGESSKSLETLHPVALVLTMMSFFYRVVTSMIRTGPCVWTVPAVGATAPRVLARVASEFGEYMIVLDDYGCLSLLFDSLHLMTLQSHLVVKNL